MRSITHYTKCHCYSADPFVVGQAGQLLVLLMLRRWLVETGHSLTVTGHSLAEIEHSLVLIFLVFVYNHLDCRPRRETRFRPPWVPFLVTSSPVVENHRLILPVKKRRNIGQQHKISIGALVA